MSERAKGESRYREISPRRAVVYLDYHESRKRRVCDIYTVKARLDDNTPLCTTVHRMQQTQDYMYREILYMHRGD